MNKTLLTILICLLLIFGASDAKQVIRLPSAEAGNLIVKRGVDIGDCFVDEQGGDTYNETWNGVGEWTESYCRDGCIANDPDYDVSGTGCGFIIEGHKMECDGTPSCDAIRWDTLGADIAGDAYYRVYFTVESETLPASFTADRPIIAVRDNGRSCSAVQIHYQTTSGGQHQLGFNYTGGPPKDTTDVIAGNIYRIEMFANNTVGSTAWRVYEWDGSNWNLLDDDGNGNTGTFPINSPGCDTGSIQHEFYNWDNQAALLFDNDAISTSGWVGE